MEDTIKKCNIKCKINIVDVFCASPVILVDFALASHLVYDDFYMMKIKSPVNVFIYVDIWILGYLN